MKADRPYTGSPHTFNGQRGKTLVKGLTIRDITDCVAMGMLSASPDPNLQHLTEEINEDLMNTPYACSGMWNYDDLYKVDGEDPVAVIQNVVCHIEHKMGIFPNVSTLKEKKEWKYTWIQKVRERISSFLTRRKVRH